MENKITEKYLKKVRSYFVGEWVFLCIGIFMLVYSLFTFYNPDSSAYIWDGFAKASTIPLGIFSIKYFISRKIKTRLIYKIQENDDNVVLTIYNNSTISLEKTLIPVEKQKPDYFITTLFSNRMGAISEDKAYEGTCITKINGKKYYLVPNIFEKEITI